MSEKPLQQFPGHLIEGELKHEDGVWYIDGPEQNFPVEAVLEQYEDDEVRFIVASIEEIEDLVEEYNERAGTDQGT